VLALAFPLRPPSRPERTRAPELEAAGVPVLVIQGERDPFGAPGDFPARVRVVGVPGDHSLRRSAAALGPIVTQWAAGIAGEGRALDPA
jgi:predicted alpha/beta-hydrolase family hydrolase